MSFVVYLFLQGLSRNIEERPTRRVYIEILTCAPIFLGVEESRSHTNEQEAERAQPQGARPAPQGARPPVMAITASLVDYAPSPLRIKKNCSIKVGLIQWPTFI